MRVRTALAAFVTASTLLAVACANGTDSVDLGEQATGDAGPSPTATDGDVLNSHDTSTNPGDSAMPTDSGKDTSTPPGSGHVVINEFATGTEFCELYNPTGATVMLGGWEVRYAAATGNAGTAGHKFASGENIGPNSFLLLKDSTWTSGMAATDGQLGLFDGTTTGATKIDGVGYGTVSTSGTLKYYEGTTAPSPTATGSVGRKTDGVDTDKNSIDFTTFTIATPGTAN